MPQGNVHFAGAGPRDVGLITLKGYQMICRADVILHDHLMQY
ncbi:MAG: SAM-dependent methyltransferase [Planctomycetota bacterium]